MTCIILEVPHLLPPHAWSCANREDFIARINAGNRGGAETPWECATPREMAENGGFSLEAADAEDEYEGSILALAAKHGADTKLYRDRRSDWTPDPIDEFEATCEFAGSDLSGWWIVESADECRDLLALLEGPNAPRVGRSGPVTAAAELRKEAANLDWIAE